jgi:hypothetical protein
VPSPASYAARALRYRRGVCSSGTEERVSALDRGERPSHAGAGWRSRGEFGRETRIGVGAAVGVATVDIARVRV